MGKVKMTDQNASKGKRTLKHYVLLTVGSVGALFVLLAVAVAAVPVISPAAGAQLADVLRGIFGPQAVAQLESISFKIEDIVNGARYQLNGGQSQISFSDTAAAANTAPGPDTVVDVTDQPAPATPEPDALAAATDQPLLATPDSQQGAALQPTTPAPQQGMESQTTAPALMVTATKSLMPNLVAPKQADKIQPTSPPITATASALAPTIAAPTASALPLTAPDLVLTWQPFGPAPADQQVMARTLVQPDPARPYAAAALVRIDLAQSELHFVLGTKEPIAVKGTPAIQRAGMIPAADQAVNRLIAAFNGGFKTINGHYGVFYQGVTLVPFKDNLATMVIYKNGATRIGAWGRDLIMTPDVVVARQNCPLLVDAGNINPDVINESRAEWGYTVKNLDTTWRSGVGLSQDGRFLIYAAGPSLTVQSLARALQQAGAYYAMQLDINGWYTRFATYTPAGNTARFAVTANSLLNQMTVPPAQFLTPYDRDFLYVTTRAG
jgi:Phosphodiester glycosidase